MNSNYYTKIVIAGDTIIFQTITSDQMVGFLGKLIRHFSPKLGRWCGPYHYIYHVKMRGSKFLVQPLTRDSTSGFRRVSLRPLNSEEVGYSTTKELSH